MSRDPNDVVRVYSGPLIDVEGYQQVLSESGIESKVVGTALTASFGSAISDSIELWIHNSDMEKAVAAIKLHEAEKGKKHPHEHTHPESDPKAGHAPPRKEQYINPDPAGN